MKDVGENQSLGEVADFEENNVLFREDNKNGKEDNLNRLNEFYNPNAKLEQVAPKESGTPSINEENKGQDANTINQQSLNETNTVNQNQTQNTNNTVDDNVTPEATGTGATSSASTTASTSAATTASTTVSSVSSVVATTAVTVTTVVVAVTTVTGGTTIKAPTIDGSAFSLNNSLVCDFKITNDDDVPLTLSISETAKGTVVSTVDVTNESTYYSDTPISPSISYTVIISGSSNGTTKNYYSSTVERHSITEPTITSSVLETETAIISDLTFDTLSKDLALTYFVYLNGSSVYSEDITTTTYHNEFTKPTNVSSAILNKTTDSTSGYSVEVVGKSSYGSKRYFYADESSGITQESFPSVTDSSIYYNRRLLLNLTLGDITKAKEATLSILSTTTGEKVVNDISLTGLSTYSSALTLDTKYIVPITLKVNVVTVNGTSKTILSKDLTSETIPEFAFSDSPTLFYDNENILHLKASFTNGDSLKSLTLMAGSESFDLSTYLATGSIDTTFTMATTASSYDIKFTGSNKYEDIDIYSTSLTSPNVSAVIYKKSCTQVNWTIYPSYYVYTPTGETLEVGFYDESGNMLDVDASSLLPTSEGLFDTPVSIPEIDGSDSTATSGTSATPTKTIIKFTNSVGETIYTDSDISLVTMTEANFSSCSMAGANKRAYLTTNLTNSSALENGNFELDDSSNNVVVSKPITFTDNYKETFDVPSNADYTYKITGNLKGYPTKTYASGSITIAAEGTDFAIKADSDPSSDSHYYAISETRKVYVGFYAVDVSMLTALRVEVSYTDDSNVKQVIGSSTTIYDDFTGSTSSTKTASDYTEIFTLDTGVSPTTVSVLLYGTNSYGEACYYNTILGFDSTISNNPWNNGTSLGFTG